MLEAKTPIKAHAISAEEENALKTITDHIFSYVPFENRANVIKMVTAVVKEHTKVRLKEMEEETLAIQKKANEIAASWEGL